MTRATLSALLISALAHRSAAHAEPPATDDAAAADLAQAADATSEVANLPAPGPAADDIDLSALGLDPSSAAFDDKLNIYGFADVGWAWQHWSRDFGFLPQDTRGFYIGNLNIYLARNLTAKARALVEVRFTLAPNGSAKADGSYVDTTAQEITNLGRTVQWGGIVIERAHVEYDLTEHLTIRAGHWLTPYGIWNIDHGSPVILGTGRPYIIGEQFFPEHQTGLDLFGSYFRRGFTLGYHATLSNGRGGAEAQQDLDTQVALGARVELATPWGVKLGGSIYRGRYTGFPAAPGAAPPTYREIAYGGDVQYDRGPLHLQGEVIARDRTYPEAGLAAGADRTPRDFGGYALIGYRFDMLWNIMPFCYVEHYRPGDHTYYRGIDNPYLGLNFRPTPSLVLKLQAARARFTDGPEVLSGQVLYYFSSQASWVF